MSLFKNNYLTQITCTTVFGLGSRTDQVSSYYMQTICDDLHFAAQGKCKSPLGYIENNCFL